MIVKNEQDVIARCLESVKDIADEIIIVDTGSSDKTVEIASHYTQNIYHFDWIDDFSAARNFSFSKATKEYILWLDADDVIEPKYQKEFITLKQTLPHTIDIVMLPYHVAFDENNQAIHSYYRERLLKRESNFKWLGAVHEAITPNGNVVFKKAAISHKKIHPSDPDRNIRIFEKLLSEGQNLEPRQQFYYARELYYHKKFHEAAEELKAFLSRTDGWAEDKSDACRRLADCYYGLSNDGKALEALLLGLKYGVPRPELCCDIGKWFFDRGCFAEAAYWYRQALKNRKSTGTDGFMQEELRGYVPCIQLCVCYDRMGQWERAERFNEMAERMKPGTPACAQNREYFQRRKEESGTKTG